MSEQDQEERAATVLKLRYVEGLSIRAIARRLHMARNTVRDLLGMRKKTIPERATRTSMVAVYDTFIRDLLAEAPDIHAPAVLERLRGHGYTGGLTVVRQRLRLLRKKPHAEAFLKLDFAPGEVVQVDWADFGFALPGIPRRVSAFVMVMGYSRKLYIEFTLSQSMGSFLRCMERAHGYFGGTTLVDVFDNMKTVVLKHTPRATVFNPTFVEYARVRQFAVQACNPGKANEKGIVERGIGFIRTRFWPGRRFSGLLDLNMQAAAWRDDFANSRVHENTGKVPDLVFEHEEKARLRSLTTVRFDCDDRLTTGVTRQHRVHFDRNDYTVPWRLVSQSVMVRADDENVQVFLGHKLVAAHIRSWSVRDDVKHESHERGLREHKPRSKAGDLPLELERLGELGRRYFKLFAAGNRSIQRETLRLVLLVELFGEGATSDAIDEVMRTGHVGSEYIEYVLKHRRGLTPAPLPLKLGNQAFDSISLREPDLSLYDALPARVTKDPGRPSEDCS
jgi:transposase